jgi:hypothetical protein
MMRRLTAAIEVRRATADDAQAIGAVFDALDTSAGYRPDGSIRESDFGGTTIRELRLVKQL